MGSTTDHQRDLYASLRGDRVVEQEGVLHLDRGAAREKMSAFTLPAPYYWVLQIVRLAVLAGASRVDLDVSVRSVEIRFDALLNPTLLQDIWNVALDPRVTRERQAIRFLALGLAAARSVGPKELVVRSGAVELVSNPDGEVTRPSESPLSGTHVRCLEKFRLSHVTDFLTELFQQPAELVVLNEFAKFAPVKLVANGETISSPHEYAGEHELGTVYLHKVEGQGIDVYAQLGGVRVHHYPAHRTIVHRGYTEFRGWALAFESDQLALDLSTMSLSEHALGPTEISQIALGQLWRYFAADDAAHVLGLTAPARRALFAMVLSRAKTPPATALIFAMLDVPIFEACGTGELISLRQTMRDHAVCYSRENLDVDLEGAPPVAWIEDEELTSMLPWSGVPASNLTEELRALKTRKTNLARWREQPKVAFDGVVVGDRTNAAQLHGSVSLAPLGKGVVRFCKERRIVQEVPISAPLVVQVDGPLEFNIEFDEVQFTDASRDFFETLIRVVPQSFRDVDRERARVLIERIAWSHLDEELRDAAKIPPPRGVDARTWLERLGELADWRLVATERGYVSVRELLTVDEAPLIASVNSGIGNPTDIILKPDGPLTAALVKMRPAIEQQAQRWLSHHHEHRFRMQPLYEVKSNHWTFQYQRTRGGAKFLLVLLDRVATGFSEVTIVYQERFLAKHLWKSAHHRWRVVIWWDEFTPTVEYRDVVRDETLRQAQLLFLEVERDAADALKRRTAPDEPVEHDEAWLDSWKDVVDGGSIVVRTGVQDEGDVSVSGDVAFAPAPSPPPYYAPILELEPEPKPEPEPEPVPLTSEEQALQKRRRLAANSGELHRVFSMLAAAREERHALLGDFMLNRLSLRSGSSPWTVRQDGASIGKDHPLAAYRSSEDPIETAFVASGAATAINAYYRNFSDTSELHLQASLLRAPLEEQEAFE